MSLETLGGLSKVTLREQAFDLLHSAITSGRMRPGERLGEVDLATRLGVSRATVREALRSLQQRALVVADERGQVRVAEPEPREIRELFRVRSSIEGLAVAEIAASPRRAELVEELRAALPPDEPGGMDFDEMMRLDLGFHETMCRLSGNSVLIDVWFSLLDRISIVIGSGRGAPVPGIMTGQHHAPIVDAIEVGDVAKALQVVSDHMATSAKVWAPEFSEESASPAVPTL